ncbi:MAG: carboxypeptidase regulatory-like domain-containing protein, partial [Blastocatellia bacterium]
MNTTTSGKEMPGFPRRIQIVKGVRSAFLTICAVLCFASASFGQRTTGSIEGTITDANGSIVPGVSVTVTGQTVGFGRTVQSDSQGGFRVLQIPAGSYKIATAAISGFAATTVEDVTVTIESVTVANIKLGVASTAESVVVTSDQLGVNLDASDSKVQTNITSKLIEQLPKGMSFTSVLRAAPAVRAEARSGGFQVDGASGSENTFIVDGLSVENFRTGTLNGVNNLPTALVAEIQIKTGGFEAEHGGASGGVVSVATKSGSDVFHGEVSSAFDASALQPRPRAAMSRFVSSNATAAAIAANPDYTYLLRPERDRFLNIYPTVALSGPLIKSRLWFLGAYSPQIFRTTRVSNFINAISNANFTSGAFVPSPRVTNGVVQTPLTYKRNIKSEYAFSRLDGAILNNLRASVTYLWNPEITDGNLPYDNITTSNPVNVTYSGFSYPSEQYARLQGGRENPNIFTSQLVYTPTGKMVATFRYGRVFL